MQIRETNRSDTDTIYKIHEAAFGQDKGTEVATLAVDLLTDKTALPLWSLMAEDETGPVGHILFTTVSIDPFSDLSAQILAPLAVMPAVQKEGVGGQLIQQGLHLLAQNGVELVFVLGHPEYYPRHGFRTAGVLGFDAPYPIPEIHADAWMVQALKPGIIGRVKGQVQCADVLNHPHHWQE